MRQATDLDLVSTQEAAEMLFLSTATVKRLALNGDLPAAHKNPGKTGAYVFNRSDIEAFKSKTASG